MVGYVGQVRNLPFGGAAGYEPALHRDVRLKTLLLLDSHGLMQFYPFLCGLRRHALYRTFNVYLGGIEKWNSLIPILFEYQWQLRPS